MIFQIPAQNSFLDSLAQGLIEKNGDHLSNHLIILPNKVSCKLLYESFLKFEKVRLPQIISLIGDDSLSPFNNFIEYLELPESLEGDELKLFVIENFYLWKKQQDRFQQYKNSLSVHNFCAEFLRIFLHFIEFEISISYFLEKINSSNFALKEQLIFSFFKFIETKFPEFLKKKGKVTSEELNNLKIITSSKLLCKLDSFTQIIAAGIPIYNDSVQEFLTTLNSQKNGVVIFHEDSHFNFNQKYQNFASEVSFWCEKKEEVTSKKIVESENSYSEGRLISKILDNNPDKRTVIVTNDFDLKNLILFNQNSFFQTDEFAKDDLILFLELLVFYLNNKISESQLLLNLEKYFTINFADFSFVGQEKKVENIKRLVTKFFKLTKSNQELLNYICFLSEGYFNKFANIISYFHNTERSIYYEGKNFLIIHPRDARLKNFTNVILAGCNQGSWDVFKSAIFSSKSFIESFTDICVAKYEQNIEYFIRQFNSKNLILTRSKFKNNKQAIPFEWFDKLKNKLEIKIYEDQGLDKFNNVKYEEQHITIELPELEKQHNFSATEFEKLIRNPYSIYASRVLNLRKRDHFAREFEDKFFGILVHDILEDYVKNFENLNDDHESYLNKNFSLGLNKKKIRFSLKTAWINRFKLIAEGIVNKFKGKKLADFLAEYKNQINLDGVELKARMDLLEICEQGINIIDYKTGQTPSQKSINDGISIQLLIEALIVKEVLKKDITSLQYWQLKGQYSEQLAISEVQDIETLISAAKTKVPEIIKKYQASNTKITSFPNENLISIYDDYFHLARKNRA